MPDKDLAFNQDLSLDIMYIYRVRVLQVVDVANGFGNASVLPGAAVDDVWTTFLAIWATDYPGFLRKPRVDSGNIFTSSRRTRRTGSVGICLQMSGVGSHNSLRLGERYHAPLLW